MCIAPAVSMPVLYQGLYCTDTTIPYCTVQAPPSPTEPYVLYQGQGDHTEARNIVERIHSLPRWSGGTMASRRNRLYVIDACMHVADSHVLCMTNYDIVDVWFHIGYLLSPSRVGGDSLICVLSVLILIHACQDLQHLTTKLRVTTYVLYGTPIIGVLVAGGFYVASSQGSKWFQMGDLKESFSTKH